MSKTKLREISWQELEQSQTSRVIVANKTRTRNLLTGKETALLFKLSINNEVLLTLPATRLPFDLTAFEGKETLIKSTAFRQAVNKGLIALLDENEVDAFYKENQSAQQMMRKHTQQLTASSQTMSDMTVQGTEIDMDEELAAFGFQPPVNSNVSDADVDLETITKSAQAVEGMATAAVAVHGQKLDLPPSLTAKTQLGLTLDGLQSPRLKTLLQNLNIGLLSPEQVREALLSITINENDAEWLLAHCAHSVIREYVSNLMLQRGKRNTSHTIVREEGLLPKVQSTGRNKTTIIKD